MMQSGGSRGLMLDVARFTLYVLSLVLLLVWLLTGRKKMWLLRVAGVTIILASILTFVVLTSSR